MFKAFLATATVLVAAPALAGGMAPAPAPAPVVVTPAAATADWTGAYAGLQYDLFDGNAVIGGDFDGNVYGIFGGYRHDFGTFVLGGEIDYMIGSLDFPITDFDVDGLLRVGLEAGYDAGPALFYATVGYANLDLSLGGVGLDGDGLFYGIGVDYRVSDRVTVGAELLHHQFDDFNNLAGNDFDFTSIGINVSYRF